MNQLSKFSYNFRRSISANMLIFLYFLLASIEIVAEYFKDKTVIFAIKPLIIPILIGLYWKTSKKSSFVYIIALASTWIANIFFITHTYEYIVMGSMFFFIYRILVIYIVVKHIKLPGIFPMIIGSIPLLSMYVYLVNLTYKELDEGFIIFVCQCLLISALGGIAVANYMLRSSKANLYLLLSTLLFAATQFIFVIRLYYESINVFQPLAMALYVISQFLFYKFLLLAENHKAGYKISKKQIGIYS